MGGVGYVVTTLVTVIFWPLMVLFVPNLALANLLFPDMNFTNQQHLSSDWTLWLGETFEDPKRAGQSILNVMQMMATFV